MEDWIEIALRLGLAALAGMLLGANRWLHHKAAGVKTHALVSIGAAVAMMIVMPVDLLDGDDPHLYADAASRVLQGLVTGVGFLGAGVIIHNARSKRIQGLTTAASIWVTTLMGAAIGMGQLALGAIAVVAIGLVLLTGNGLERFVGKHFGDHAAPAKEDDSP